MQGLRYPRSATLVKKVEGEEKLMAHSSREAVIAIFLLAVVVLACKNSRNTNSARADNSNTSVSSSSKPDADGVIHSGTGVEEEKPAPGKANVQGKVFFNEKPVADIEVKLCEKFSRFIGGCSGETFTAKTDGEYLIKVHLQRQYQDYLKGMGWKQKLEIRLDGKLLPAP